MIDQTGKSIQHEIKKDCRIGTDHPLHGRMADVPLVPKGHVLQCRHGIGAHQPGQPGKVLRQHRVAFVGHGGRSLLPRREILLGFTNLGPLKKPDLLRKLVYGGCNDGECREILCMTVTLNDLRRGRRRLQRQLFTDILFNGRIDK